MQEFLNPKSMVTPGAAGALMMFLVNGLSMQFPELPGRYVALMLSFIIGAVAFKAVKLTLIERGIYWVLNSLVIFVVGFGANGIGREATTPIASTHASGTMIGLSIPTVYAADDQKPSTVGKIPSTKNAATKNASAAKSGQETEKLKVQVEQLQRENERLKLESASKVIPPPRKGEESFFKKW